MSNKFTISRSLDSMPRIRHFYALFACKVQMPSVGLKHLNYLSRNLIKSLFASTVLYCGWCRYLSEKRFSRKRHENGERVGRSIIFRISYITNQGFLDHSSRFKLNKMRRYVKRIGIQRMVEKRQKEKGQARKRERGEERKRERERVSPRSDLQTCVYHRRRIYFGGCNHLPLHRCRSSLITSYNPSAIGRGRQGEGREEARAATSI